MVGALLGKAIVYCEDYMKHTNTLGRQNEEF
jgi:hypothetical protein